MSMTENEAKALAEWFKTRKGKTLKLNDEGIDFVVEALTDIQQYRAIGLTPELIEAMQGHNIALINDLGEYQAIGTVEQCRTAVERIKNIQSVIESVRETCYQMGLDESQAEILTDGIKEKLDWSE